MILVVVVAITVVLYVIIVAVVVVVMSNACTCNDLPDLASLHLLSITCSVRVVLGALGFEFSAVGWPGRAWATQPRRELVRPVHAGCLDR